MPLDIEIKDSVDLDPSTILLYGSQKSGKSKIAAELTKMVPKGQSVIISTKQEEGRVELHGGAYYKCPTYGDYVKIINHIKSVVKQDGKPIDFLIIDNCSDLDDWSEHVGTMHYQNTIQGQSFNIDKKTGKRLKYGDPGYETVHDIGKGYGYRWSRMAMVEWFDELASLAKHTIFIAHLKVNKSISDDNSSILKDSEIDLTGKVPSIFAKKADTVCKMVIDGKDRYLSFSKKDSDIGTGSAIPYPERVLISSNKSDDPLKPVIETYWDSIFRNYKFLKQ